MRRSWPQMPIRKYMGISVNSQKDEEEEEIERDEHADHRRFDHQQRDEKAFHVFVN